MEYVMPGTLFFLENKNKLEIRKHYEERSPLQPNHAKN